MRLGFILKFLLAISTLAFVVVFSYSYPRFLVAWLGESSPWVSYLYTYGMGSLFFLLSVILIFSRKVFDSKRRKEEWFWLILISCGMFVMFFLHGLWIFLAIHFPQGF